MSLNVEVPYNQGAGLYLPLTGGALTGPLALGANKITGLANGTATTDAATFGQVQTTEAALNPALQYNDLLGWSYDVASPQVFYSSTIAAYVFLERVPLPTAITVTNVLANLGVLGATLTHSFLALFKSDGTIIGQSTDQSTAWGAAGATALAVGSGPFSIAIDPAGTYAYVANEGDNSVTKINLSTFATVGSALTVGSGPFSIAIDPAGTYAYVANEGGNSVTKINLSTFATVGSALAVGSSPFGIAIDPTGTYAYTANHGDNSVTKINLSTFATVGSALAVGSGPFSIAIDPAGTYAYVANEGGTVTKINLSTFATVGSALAVGSGPHSIAIDPTGTYAYVANYGASTVTKINLSTFLTVGSALAVGSSPFGIAIDPTGTYAYVANEGGNSVTKINLSTFATVGSALAVGSNPYSIAIDPTGTYAYVANYGAGTVTKMSTFLTGIYTLPLVGGPKVCTPLAPNDFLWTAIYIGTQVTGPIFGSTGAVLVPLLNAGCTVARSRCGYVIQADTATLASFNPSTIIASSFNYWMAIS